MSEERTGAMPRIANGSYILDSTFVVASLYATAKNTPQRATAMVPLIETNGYQSEQQMFATGNIEANRVGDVAWSKSGLTLG
jgi:hypothetical protein